MDEVVARGRKRGGWLLGEEEGLWWLVGGVELVTG